MQIVVQKFGGTSLSTPDARNRAIEHISRELQHSRKVVVVVSAMGRKGDPYATDTLLDLIEETSGGMADREKDLLLSCGELISAAMLSGMLVSRGISAAALTGGQAGIITSTRYGNARIVSIRTERVLQRLATHDVVVVTGFQGVTPSGEVTTLGRGGSDTTAAALGAALNAQRTDIFTDVAGVFTADPRIVRKARPLSYVTYHEASQMALSGAKVIHPRAVEIAMSARLPLRIRSTFSDDEGTWVGSEPPAASATSPISDYPVVSIASSGDVTQLEVSAGQDNLELHLDVFRLMAQHHISVDFINMNPSGVIYTVFRADARRAVRVLREAGYEPGITDGCAKVSVIGGGMNGVPGIMATVVESLTKHNIGILQSADSNSAIWVLVREAQAAGAVNALHEAFQLGEERDRNGFRQTSHSDSNAV